MKSIIVMALAATSLIAAEPEWIPLFNGKDLDGWKANENPTTFSVKDGELVVKGDRAHLFYTGKAGTELKNFELKLEIMTKPKANSGVYIHTAFQPSGWPDKGYEIQVNNTHGDPKKTAGVYGIKDNFTAPAKDDEWFTMHIIVKDKTIVAKVNDKVISEWVEPADWAPPKNFAGRKLSSGTIAIQGHDPGSEVHYRKIEIKPLP